MSLSRAAGSKMASALVLMLCAALFAVLRVGADTIRAREVPGAGDPDTLASATIEWAESRPFDQSGIDARFVSVLAESDGVERLAGQTSLELGARSAGRELKRASSWSRGTCLKRWACAWPREPARRRRARQLSAMPSGGVHSMVAPTSSACSSSCMGVL